MGANFSNFNEKLIKTFAMNEFEKSKGSKKRDYLVLSDILSVQLPEDYQFNFHHLGTLYCMDWNKDGRFSKEDILNFSSLAIGQIKKYK